MPTNAGDSGSLQEGELFAGYTIVRLLGAGGMGQVYLAKHPRLPRHDALKILSAEYTADVEYRRRFDRECDLAASLYNQHIVGIHDRGEFNGQLWLSMDYVEGTDAAHLLNEKYPAGMPHAEVVEIISAVAEALDYAHSRGLLHRDVKPANILLSEPKPRRRILLADFGIAREAGEISGLTVTNVLMGTTAYCSPEQLRGAHLDGRADQYGLGCTAFHLLTGTAPFEHTNPAVVISQHLSGPPPLLSQRRPELAPLDPVIVKVLAKNPGDRYPTCSDFAAALAGQPGATVQVPVAQAPGLPHPQAPLHPHQPPPTGRRIGQGTLIASLIAVALVVLAFVLGLLLLSTKSDAPQASAPAPLPSKTAAQTPSTSTAAAPLVVASILTDAADVLRPQDEDVVMGRLTDLLQDRGIRLYVVYVKTFDGVPPDVFAGKLIYENRLDEAAAILVVATDDREYEFYVPPSVAEPRNIDVGKIDRDHIRPAVREKRWRDAALEAVQGLGGGQRRGPN
ncbi:serine/threonine protein kinase [Mycobacterium intermedium]|uniref:non-specific serine/threonine protein kinase n=1 Tax=Mycobacterium intermedium TaxID=28445 RepID=A0A1E3SMK4_MYCIE|nr:serine/threonine-protein kinase [Mycobacterium intermedium]MCV6967019.1 protein kinase [Mycobacterium intermedium]ODR03329.1 serine/threonine protein kinase [Mycobacterium intermedium]OPE52909.1 serine/threonine protein kinase [Mycobacterium intermedium]ORB09711.1 serine/threonine protein kinase [Mycobacterium intermedium]